jgi:hypothetical protein
MQTTSLPFSIAAEHAAARANRESGPPRCARLRRARLARIPRPSGHWARYRLRLSGPQTLNPRPPRRPVTSPHAAASSGGRLRRARPGAGRVRPALARAGARRRRGPGAWERRAGGAGGGCLPWRRYQLRAIAAAAGGAWDRVGLRLWSVLCLAGSQRPGDALASPARRASRRCGHARPAPGPWWCGGAVRLATAVPPGLLHPMPVDQACGFTWQTVRRGEEGRRPNPETPLGRGPLETCGGRRRLSSGGLDAHLALQRDYARLRVHVARIGRFGGGRGGATWAGAAAVARLE